MNSNIINFINNIETRLYNKLIEKEKGIIIFEGKRSILMSAPHSVEQLREGKIKCAEPRTAPIVQFLYEKTECFGAFKTINFNDDANYDSQNYYKDELIRIIKENNIKVLVDLHNMSNKREHDIDIATGFGRNILYREDLLKIVKNNFISNNIEKIEVDYLFNATYENTVAATISRECNIPCFEVEINCKLLDYNFEDNKLINLLDALSKTIQDLEKSV